MDNLFLRTLRQWIPLTVGISALTFIMYVAIQQNIRMNANDPQIQIVEDTASTLNSGRSVPLSDTIDVSKSLAPFTIIYDKHEKVTRSNALLNGKIPTIPAGVLKGINGETRITWQPEDGVRLATVVVAYNNGYVVVGRNMREVEMRENNELQIVLLGWIIALFATFSSVYGMQTLLKGKK